jgi:predicted DNA binding CopG/RHH family protein
MRKPKHIPKFRSEAEEARFWQTHSLTDFAHELREVRSVKFPKPRKRLISLRMDDAQIKSLKKVAAGKGIGYLTLIRMWVVSRLSRETDSRHNLTRV